MSTDGARLLDRARADLRDGHVEQAWQSCRAAARIGRANGDAAVVAEAATIIRGGPIGAWAWRAEQHALCREALSMLGDGATSSPWTREPASSPRPDADDRFLELRARHTALTHPAHVEERLALADEVIALDGHLAWGTLWRLDALFQLGRRVEINAELMSLTAAVRQLEDPVWNWRLAEVRASLALLDGRFADVPPLIDEAAGLGAACGLEEASYLALVMRSSLALQSGTGAAQIEGQVRRLLAGAPFFAYGWHALLLAACGRTEEALDIWRALAPQLDALPPESPEWLVATAGHVTLCRLAGDTGSAAKLYDLLLPLEHLHVTGGAMTPYEGPVSLYLGRLAGQLGDHAAARTHLDDAARRSTAVHAPVFTRAARAAGQAPADPLTNREREIAGLVANGSSNREIAAGLSLSERTVENHVGNILRKLRLRSRTALASWVYR